MSYSTCPGADMLLLARHDLLDDDAIGEAESVREHVSDCSECRDGLASLEDGLAAPTLPFDPKDAFAEICDRLADATVGAAPSFHPDVHLLCTYCKDHLPGAQATYCAQCLATHHADCFAEHGRCASCAGLRVVRTTEAPAPQRRQGYGRWAGMLMVSVLTGGAVAALLPDGAPAPAIEIAPTPLVTPGPTPALPEAALIPAGPELTTVVYSVAGILAKQGAPLPGDSHRPAWELEYERLLSSRTVTLNFPDTPFTEVVGFLQDITGLNIIVAASVAAEETSVSVRLRDIRLRDALDIILEQAGLTRRFQNETLVILPRDQRPQRLEPAEWPLPIDEVARPQTPLKALGDQVKRAVVEALGPQAWASPAALTLRSGAIEVRQFAPGHTAIRELLDPMRPADPPEGLEEAWFVPDWGRGPIPAVTRAQEFARRANTQRVSLSFEDTPFDEAVSFIQDVTGIECRMDPSAAEIVQNEQVSVSLRLKGISLKNALNLIAASNEKLVWDVDRDGILIRTHSARSFEARLAGVAEDAIETWSRDDSSPLRARLQSQAITVNFTGTPVDEVVDFLRDITGLNYVIAAGVDTKKTVTCEFSALDLEDALTRLLAPLELGTLLQDGVVMVVPLSRASELTELQALLQAAEATTFGEPLRGATLSQLVERLEAVTGAYVVLSAEAQRCCGRVALGSDLNVKQALEGCAPQIGLRFAWGWIATDKTEPAHKLVLALDVDRGVETLQAAVARATELSAWTGAPETANAALAKRRHALLETLETLAVSSDAQLSTRIEAVRGADVELKDVLTGHRWFAMDVRKSFVAPTEKVFEHLQAKARELRKILAAQHDERAEEERIGKLQDELLAASARDDGWKARTALRERLQAEVVDAERKLARERRDRSLQIARARSELNQLEGRVRELNALPSWPSETAARAKQLVAGASWEQVFPEGVAAWSEAQFGDAKVRVRAGLYGLRALGLTLKLGEDGSAAVGDAGPKTGLEAGDVILSIAGEQTWTPLSVLEQIGKHAGETVSVVVQRDVETVISVALPAPPKDD